MAEQENKLRSPEKKEYKVITVLYGNDSLNFRGIKYSFNSKNGGNRE